MQVPCCSVTFWKTYSIDDSRRVVLICRSSTCMIWDARYSSPFTLGPTRIIRTTSKSNETRRRIANQFACTCQSVISRSTAAFHALVRRLQMPVTVGSLAMESDWSRGCVRQFRCNYFHPKHVDHGRYSLARTLRALPLQSISNVNVQICIHIIAVVTSRPLQWACDDLPCECVFQTVVYLAPGATWVEVNATIFNK
jgi:hypothetical protein